MPGDDPELRYANLGADAFALEVERAGLQPPSRVTINRILVRNNLAQPRPKGKRKQKLPDDYPWPKADKPNQVHLFDFVPPYTPEANPIIESFNGLWDQNFWQRTEFQCLKHVHSELPLFVQYSRYRRPPAALDYQTPDQIFPDFQPAWPPADLIPNLQEQLPISAGQIHFIRFVSQTGNFIFLNEEWQLDPEQWAGKTICATVNTPHQQLNVFHQARRLQSPSASQTSITS